MHTYIFKLYLQTLDLLCRCQSYQWQRFYFTQSKSPPYGGCHVDMTSHVFLLNGVNMEFITTAN